MKRRQINEFLDMVQDCKDRLPALAAELNADNYRVTWSIEDEGDGQVEYNCRVGIQMPHHWMGSYVSANHPFEEAEKSIRNVHAEYEEEQRKRKRREEEELIKRALYEDYLAQKSSAKV